MIIIINIFFLIKYSINVLIDFYLTNFLQKKVNMPIKVKQ